MLILRAATPAAMNRPPPPACAQKHTPTPGAGSVRAAAADLLRTCAVPELTVRLSVHPVAPGSSSYDFTTLGQLQRLAKTTCFLR